MNIILVIDSLESGGAARALTHMANYWVSRGAKVTVCTYKKIELPPFYTLDSKVSVECIWTYKDSKNIFETLVNAHRRIRHLRQSLTANSPDAIISFIHETNIKTLLYSIGSKIPVIVAERSSPAYEPLPFRIHFQRRLLYHFASRIVVQTSKAAEYFYPLLSPKVRVIPNQVLPPERNPDENIPSETILAVGRLNAEKRHDLLIRAFAYIADEHPTWSLSIAGEGPLRDELQRLIDETGFSNRISLLGQVKDVGSLYAASGVFAMTSSFEGFPNALCEAMAAGLPCLSTDCPDGPGEIIHNGENGILVPNKDIGGIAKGLDSLLSDIQLRRRLGLEARKISITHSEERIMQEWKRLLGDIC